MNRKLIHEYLKTTISTILIVVVLWGVTVYFFVFAEKSVDTDLPQYLIWSFNQYVKLEPDSVTITKEGEVRLETHHLWVQILDQKGAVVCEKNAPDYLPDQYSTYELIDYTLQSNQLYNFTIFTVELPNSNGYGIVIGCDSKLVNKVSYRYIGNGKDAIMKVFYCFLIVTMIAVLMESYIFSKKISKPVTNIITNIHLILDNQLPVTNKDKSIFDEVFIKLEYLYEELQMGKKMRREWISNISHDIKTPMSSIKGYAELLNTEEYEFKKNEIQAYSGEILKAEKIIEELMEELKTSQMLNDGKLELKKEKVNIVELIEECKAGIPQKMLNDSEIKIEYTKEKSIFCDRMLIKRSIMNILYNALLYNRNKICITIIVIGLEEKEKQVRIIIQDNGIGMGKQELTYIFERYYRGTNSEQTKGTGLGLAIAKEAIAAHKGTIHVWSEEGKGTKFEIVL